MTDTFAKRLAAFEPTILQIVNFFGITDRLDGAGYDRDDFIAILRETVWDLIRVQTAASKEFVCKGLWNRARDLMRLRNRKIVTSRVEIEPDQCPDEGSTPWEQIDLRLDLQKVVDALPPEDVQALWTVAQEGRAGAQRYLGLSKTTLHRRIVLAQERSRAVLAA